MHMINPDVIKALLIYEPDTGLFRWRNPSYRQAKGWFKGTKGVRKYRRITINGKHIMAHQVAWVLMTGHWPLGEIDHRNRDQGNNKWLNLRDGTHGQNMMNRSIGKNNKTGALGVSIYIDKGKLYYRATITVNYKKISLGVFNNIDDATTARRIAELELFNEKL